MRKRNLLTTIISVLCICSLLAANLINGPAFVSKAAAATEQKTPEELGYERIILSDFGISDGTYDSTTGNTYGPYSNATSLNGKYLDVNVKQAGPVGSEVNTRIQYGGGGAGQQNWGLRIVQLWTGSYSCLKFTMSAYANESYELQLGDALDINLKVATNVTDTQVTVDVWINDVRQEQMVFTGNCVSEMGNYLGIFAQDQAITVGTPVVDTPQEPSWEEITPEELGYERITLSDFGISDGTYDSTTGNTYGPYSNATSLNGKYLDVNVKQAGPVGSEVNTRIQYGGGGAGQQNWGLRIVQLWTGSYSCLKFTMSAYANESYELQLGDAIDINLKVATNVTDTQVTVDVWINDVRQEQMVFTGNCVSEMGNYLGIFTQDQAITVTTTDKIRVKDYSKTEYLTYRPVTPEVLGYERITLDDFDISDGTYSATDSETCATYGQYSGGDSLNGKYLDVDIYQDGPVGSEHNNTRIQYGGGGAGQQSWGLRIVQFWTGSYSCLRFTMSMYPNEVYELQLGDAIDINLKVATNVTDTQVTADVWINDVRQEQMVFTGDCVNEMGNYMGIFTWHKPITVNTPEAPEPSVVNNKYTAPTETGYLFAGWYADEACTQALLGEPTEDTVYAKFVPKSVFTVKAQVTDDLQETDDWGDIRFLTTVESKDYTKVGFDITIEGFEKQTIPFTTVYRQLYMVNGDKEIDTIDAQKEFSNLSQFFVAYAYWDVPQAAFELTFTVTPWWVTQDGTLVYGDTVEKTVLDGINQNGGVE